MEDSSQWLRFPGPHDLPSGLPCCYDGQMPAFPHAFEKGDLEEASPLACFPRSRVTAADLDNRCGLRSQLLQKHICTNKKAAATQLGPSVTKARLGISGECLKGHT